MEAFVLGLDGATFSLIDKWLEELPNFKHLVHTGVRGDLLSTIPPHTALAWPSIITGVHPGKHGIYQFWKTQTKGYQPEFFTSRDIRYKTFAQLLNEQGKKVGFVNIPMTHPPFELDGYIISWPLSNTLRYSYPASLVGELARYGGHYLHDLATMYTGQDNYHELALTFTANRLKSIKYLMKNYEVDFVFSVFTEIDRVSHYYWKYMDITHPAYTPDPVKENAIFHIYKETDHVLGELLEELEEDTIFCIVSDHGFTQGKQNFYIHRFLEENGLLKTLGNPHEEEVGENNLDNRAWYLFNLDMRKTVAYMPVPGCYGLNINLKGRQERGIVEPEDYERVCGELIQLLKQVQDPYLKRPLFKAVLPKNLVYKGPRYEEAPDIILIPGCYSTMVHHSLHSERCFGPADPNGLHDEQGILLLHGPCFHEGIRIKGASIVDVLPTLLYAMGLKIPQDIDGNILIRVFKPEFLASRPAVFEGFSELSRPDESEGYTMEEKREIEKRLKAMGYL